VRYYAVGEYGDTSGRPHFHVCLFGYPGCSNGITRVNVINGEADWMNCCPTCRLIGKTWGKGLVQVGVLTPQSASYCANYTVKKMTSWNDKRLNGRHPEFARMSLKPGIGHDSLWEVASTMMRYDLDERMIDVPISLASGKSVRLPLGRYLRKRLRGLVGRDDATPKEVLAAMEEEVRPLREAAFEASRSFKEVVIEASAGEVANLEAKFDLYRGKKSL